MENPYTTEVTYEEMVEESYGHYPLDIVEKEVPYKSNYINTKLIQAHSIGIYSKYEHTRDNSWETIWKGVAQDPEFKNKSFSELLTEVRRLTDNTTKT